MAIENLALKGGGVKGIAYVGALRELDHAGLLSGIQRVAGTSVGSLLAGMICAGYSVDQIENLLKHHFDLKKFKIGWNPLRISRQYGLYSGSYILDFIHRYLIESPKNLPPNVTFRQMKEAGCKDLYVFACDLNLHTIQEFSAFKTPEVVVAEAIRASMSIPLFFKAWQFSNSNPNDHIFVDGGIAFNYPLGFFDNERFASAPDFICEEAIGLYLHDKASDKEVDLSFSQPLSFIKQLFETLLNVQNIDIGFETAEGNRSIRIDGLGIPATDFNLTLSDMESLIQSGSDCAKMFLLKNKLIS
ncbi:patatin-like phospholipase family protein [Aquiflexum sp. TKW24L]|uniref:patatin-like phospholipase family protein n=1 Tax=Aquiflexum sp. TKW24L TaxID=2942212 RepID=UPI0020C0609F|nr:patatin-like phospholipase family protein [Aquiflexum sp. TKW24L]MCL6259018.1 patatin-like phospholipase family protein [Aquiflexum sp. TKW24L]